MKILKGDISRLLRNTYVFSADESSKMRVIRCSQACPSSSLAVHFLAAHCTLVNYNTETYTTNSKYALELTRAVHCFSPAILNHTTFYYDGLGLTQNHNVHLSTGLEAVMLDH